MPHFYPPLFVFAHNWLVVGGGADARDGGSSHDAGERAPLYSVCKQKQGIRPMTREYISLKVTACAHPRGSLGALRELDVCQHHCMCSNKIEKRREGER